MDITYNEKKTLNNILDISLRSHDFVTLERDKNINDYVLRFWKSNWNNNTYTSLFVISLIDFQNVLCFMDIAHGLMQINNSNIKHEFTLANLKLDYTLVPKDYFGNYYYMKTFCSNILISSTENFKQKIYLPINSNLWKEKINEIINIVDIKIYVNGKLFNEPLSIETAKRLGIVK